MKKTAFYYRESFLYAFAMAVSLLLSFYINVRETVINPDAVCYLSSAEAVSTLGIKGAMQLCGQSHWPFYPLLINGFAHLFHSSYLVSAYVLDALFSLVSVVVFIRLVKALGASLPIMWLAALTILLAHEFNSVREYIIRDHGFWAFYLTSILLLIHYFRHPTFKVGIAWSLCTLVATLFRIEGAIFLLVMPWFVWLLFSYSFWQRAKYFFTLHLLTLVICGAGLVWMSFHPQQTLDKLGRVAEIPHQLQQGWGVMFEHYQTAKAALVQHILVEDSVRDAGAIWILVLISWYAMSVIINLSLAYSFLLFYAVTRKITSWTSTTQLVLSGYIAVNLIVTFGFLIEHLFLSNRYLMALSLVLMLWVPFALYDLLSQWSAQRSRVVITLVAFFIFISALGGIIDFGYSKAYLRQAGDWLAENVPTKATLYANDYQLMYYSKHFGNALFTPNMNMNKRNLQGIAHGEWKQFDYLALRLDKKATPETAAILASIKVKPLRVFQNKRGDQVVIYQILSQEKVS